MTILFSCIFWICYAALWFAVVRFDVHMFQHNSYREERYARWFRGGYKFWRAGMIAVLAIMGALPFVTREIFLGFASAMMVAIAWAELRTTYKKPIVYTMRVKRLFLTAVLFTAAVIGAMAYFAPQYTALAALVLLFMPVVMLTSNLLNKPLEAMISRWYYNIARIIGEALL